MITLMLTEEEGRELVRTLMGRIDLDLAQQVKDCTSVDKYGVVSVNEERMRQVLYLKDVNQRIYTKLLAIPGDWNSLF